MSDESGSSESEDYEKDEEIKIKILSGTENKKVPDSYLSKGDFWHPIRLIKDFNYDDVIYLLHYHINSRLLNYLFCIIREKLVKKLQFKQKKILFSML
jgi:hypothetical protein